MEVITLKRSNNDTEGWQKIKKLGSFLGDKEDIKNRKRLANIASKPVSIEVIRRRWNLLGHILILNKETPARKTMKFVFEASSNKTFRGRKRATIYTTINCNIKKTKENNPSSRIGEIKSKIDLRNIGIKARNKKHWKVVIKQVSKQLIPIHQYINNSEKLLIMYTDVEENKQK